MANKYDLKSVYISNIANISGTFSIGELIPAGKTRFLTYLRVERAGAVTSAATLITGMSAIVASTPIAGTHASCEMSDVSGGALMPLHLAGITAASGAGGLPNAVFANQIPDRPEINHPLISVAGGASAYMAVGVHAVAPAVKMFAQYYDE